jgi:hypothetical protein
MRKVVADRSCRAEGLGRGCSGPVPVTSKADRNRSGALCSRNKDVVLRRVLGAFDDGARCGGGGATWSSGFSTATIEPPASRTFIVVISNIL